MPPKNHIRNPEFMNGLFVEPWLLGSGKSCLFYSFGSEGVGGGGTFSAGSGSGCKVLELAAERFTAVAGLDTIERGGVAATLVVVCSTTLGIFESASAAASRTSCFLS